MHQQFSISVSLPSELFVCIADSLASYASGDVKRTIIFFLCSCSAHTQLWLLCMFHSYLNMFTDETDARKKQVLREKVSWIMWLMWLLQSWLESLLCIVCVTCEIQFYPVFLESYQRFGGWNILLRSGNQVYALLGCRSECFLGTLDACSSPSEHVMWSVACETWPVGLYPK